MEKGSNETEEDHLAVIAQKAEAYRQQIEAVRERKEKEFNDFDEKQNQMENGRKSLVDE